MRTPPKTAALAATLALAATPAAALAKPAVSGKAAAPGQTCRALKPKPTKGKTTAAQRAARKDQQAAFVACVRAAAKAHGNTAPTPTR
jgi:hypothetical protein